MVYTSDYSDLHRIKLEMADLGWSIKESITKDGWCGKTGYSIWFERNEWHGKNTYSITGSAVVFHGHHNDIHDITRIVAMVRRISEMAKNAYKDFTNAVPMQTARGTVVEAIMYVPFHRGKEIK